MASINQERTSKGRGEGRGYEARGVDMRGGTEDVIARRTQ
jgi:hypothetical protein